MYGYYIYIIIVTVWAINDNVYCNSGTPLICKDTPEMRTSLLIRRPCMHGPTYVYLDYSCNKFYNLIGQHWDYKLLRTPLPRTPLLRMPTSMHVN